MLRFGFEVARNVAQHLDRWRFATPNSLACVVPVTGVALGDLV
jgi:hypothetical protein